MIIYSSSIWLENTTQMAEIFSTITYWLHTKTKNPIFPETFLNQPQRSFSDGSSLEIIKTDIDFPHIFSFRYIQKDNEVFGRRWITEIGIKQETNESDIQCSFLVQTNEISVNVPQPKQTTRPWLITELIKRCNVSRKTVGRTIKTIDDLSDAEALAYEIESSERNYPIIIVSPTSEGDYLVDLEKLLSQTSGLAETIQIQVGADTYGIAAIFGKTHSAYNGAINILFPIINRDNNEYLPTHLLLPERINEILNTEDSVEFEILKSISHRMNVPNSWLHITPELVKGAIRKRELDKLRQHSEETGELKQYIELLEEDIQQKQVDNEKLLVTIDTLQGDNNYYSSEYDISNEEKKLLQLKVDGLLGHLDDYKKSHQERGELRDCSEELRELIYDYLNGYITPYRSLELISFLLRISVKSHS